MGQFRPDCSLSLSLSLRPLYQNGYWIHQCYMAIVEEAEEEEEADEEEGNAVDELVDTDVNELTRLLHSCQANFQRIPFPLDTIRKKKKKKKKKNSGIAHRRFRSPPSTVMDWNGFWLLSVPLMLLRHLNKCIHLSINYKKSSQSS